MSFKFVSSKSRKLSIIAAILAFVFVLGACGQAAPAPAPAPAEPAPAPAATPAPAAAETPVEEAAAVDYQGEVVWVTMSEPPALDPHFENDAASSDINTQMFEGLMTFTPEPDNRLVPLLATDHPTVSADGLVYTFNLRQGVYFHDGTPFNADAVRISYERLLDRTRERVAPALFVLEMMDRIEVVDDYTVNIHLSHAFAPFPAHLTHQVGKIIAPSAIAEEEAGGRSVSENPVGTGPFMLDYRVHGDYIRLVPNPNHWRATPAISIRWTIVPDTDTRMAMLETGQANGLLGTSADGPRLNAMSGVDVRMVETASVNYIGFNVQSGPTSDRRVRQAISMAIDLDAIIWGLAEGNASPAVGPIAPLVSYSAAAIAQPLPFDPVRARELLVEAGHADGLTINYWSNTGNAMRARAGELIQDNLREIGIELILTQVDWADYLVRTGAGEHDMFYLGWNTMTMDADYGISPLLHTNNLGPAGNRAFFSDPRVDALLDEGATTTSSARRAEVYREITEILIYEAPMLFLFHPHSPIATNGINGMESDFNARPYFWNVTLR